MNKSAYTIFAAIVISAVSLQAQGIMDGIRTPEKAVPTVNQSLEGTWLLELRRPGQPAAQPPVLNLVTFHPDGTVVASAADGAQSAAHGSWVRVGDRKFLQTMFTFNFNEARALTTIFKVRINVQVSADGLSSRGTTELVILDREGKVMATVPGGSYTGIRLSPEIPGDFYDFQKLQ